MSRMVGYSYFFVGVMPFVVYLAIFEGMWPLVIVYAPFFGLSVYLVYRHLLTLKAKSNMTKASEFLMLIENLELDHLDVKFQEVLRSMDSNGRVTVRYVGDDEKEAIDMIDWMLRLLEKDNAKVKQLQEEFSLYRPTDTRFYRYAGIVFYAYLMDHNMEDFVKRYKVFQDTLMSRTEYRVMNRMPGTVKFFDGEIALDFKLLDILYSYYGKGEDVFTEVTSYTVQNRYQKVLYEILLKHYSEDSEKPSIMTDFEEDYQWALGFRETYKAVELTHEKVE